MNSKKQQESKNISLSGSMLNLFANQKDTQKTQKSKDYQQKYEFMKRRMTLKTMADDDQDDNDKGKDNYQRYRMTSYMSRNNKNHSNKYQTQPNTPKKQTNYQPQTTIKLLQSQTKLTKNYQSCRTSRQNVIEDISQMQGKQIKKDKRQTQNLISKLNYQQGKNYFKKTTTNKVSSPQKQKTTIINDMIQQQQKTNNQLIKTKNILSISQKQVVNLKKLEKLKDQQIQNLKKQKKLKDQQIQNKQKIIEQLQIQLKKTSNETKIQTQKNTILQKQNKKKDEELKLIKTQLIKAQQAIGSMSTQIKELEQKFIKQRIFFQKQREINEEVSERKLQANKLQYRIIYQQLQDQLSEKTKIVQKYEQAQIVQNERIQKLQREKDKAKQQKEKAQKQIKELLVLEKGQNDEMDRLKKTIDHQRKLSEVDKMKINGLETKVKKLSEGNPGLARLKSEDKNRVEIIKRKRQELLDVDDLIEFDV